MFKTVKQLLRRPIKTASGILIVALAFAILVTCVGQYTATGLTRANIDDRYTSIALIASEYVKQSNYSTGYGDGSRYPGVVEDVITNLTWKRPDLVKTQSYTGLVSAYIPDLTIDNFTRYEYGYTMSRYNHGYPYRGAMLTVKLTKIGSIGVEDYQYGMDGQVKAVNYTTFLCVGTVEGVLGLDEGFGRQVGKTIVLHVKVFKRADFEALNLQEGKTYLVYGEDFVGKNEWALKNSIGMNSPDWGRSAHEELFGKVEGHAGIYHYAPMLEQFDCTLTISDPSALPIYGIYSDDDGDGVKYVRHDDLREWWYWDGKRVRNERIPVEEYARYYQRPTIVELNGSAEEFLASEEGALWQEKLDEMQINNHGFPVLCVEKLGYQAVFAREQARIVEGRDFTEEELQSGAKVCIISQSVAMKSGVQVGDTIEMQTYAYDPTLTDQIDEMGCSYCFPNAAMYSKKLGFTSESETYTIVGIYRQEDAWRNMYDTYGFTPNTIFVPKASVTAEMLIYEKGIYSSLVVQPGKIDEIRAVAAEYGVPDLFICYDQGYSEIVAALDSYEEVSQKALYIGLAAYGVIMLLFLLLFPLQERRALMLMSTMGASAWRKNSHTFFGTFWILVPGAVLGGYAGSKLWTKIAAALMDWINIQITLDSDMNAVAPKLTVVSLIVVAFAVLIVSVAQCGSRKLMKRK